MTYFLPYTQLDALLTALMQAGYRCIGPQVSDGAIVYKDLHKSAQLPWGIRCQQTPGTYQLQQTQAQTAFAWANGAQAIKPYLFKADEMLYRVQRDNSGKLHFQAADEKNQPIALLGARACDLAALAVQDRVFMQANHSDPRYIERRNALLIIAVNCSQAGQNCFCVSTQTGPKAKEGYDIALTEITHGFIATSDSQQGEDLLTNLGLDAAKASQMQQATDNIEQATQMQTKRLPHNNSRMLRDILLDNLDHPQWDDVAARCLSCGNCTSVCPTCFCHEVTETPSLDGNSSEHHRQWDSCFSNEHSYLHSTTIRPDTKSRYKQWLTHKLATWWDQFDTSGCVGCGRCITWCPVGIDITAEMTAIATAKKSTETVEQE